MTRNLLGEETSPYLLQHQDNPVHWMPWGDAALKRAQQENKPVLLSIGYAACHWCHVMAHECFENPDIAGVMNELVVSVKVDREERPDIDAIYQASLAMLGEQGGWPLTMFLTPQGEPFWGGTYFPPEPRWGRPGFVDLLRAVANTHAGDAEPVQKNVKALREGLARLSQPEAGNGITGVERDAIAERLVGEVDLFRGGIKRAPKFPQPQIFEQIWRAWKRTSNPLFQDAVTRTLDNICQGGIYDHLGGGFARYSVDEMWLVPHFEKMLYDNAALIELLTLVWQETRTPLYAARVRETVGWLLREMTDAGGGFVSSLDADSEGVEGKYYVWSTDEVAAALGDDAETFSQIYNVIPDGNWEGANILNRLAAMAEEDPETEATLARNREALLQFRGRRIPPGKDDKVLADWNGLMIAALAFAGPVLGEPEWVEAARRAYDFVQTEMRVDGRLQHSWCAGQARHPATLDDHANMARAALALHEATGDGRYLEDTIAWVEATEAHYRDPQGGYFFTADDTPNLITRTKTAHDSPTPSGNGTLAGVSARLFLLTGEGAHHDRAKDILRAFSGEIEQNFFPFSTLINASETLESCTHIFIAGDAGAEDTAALVAAVNGASLPDRILTILRPGDAPPENSPAAGKSHINGRATAYVCRGPVCSAPATSPEALAALLGATS